MHVYGCYGNLKCHCLLGSTRQIVRLLSIFTYIRYIFGILASPFSNKLCYLLFVLFFIIFLRCNAMLAQYVPSWYVCVSVTLQYCIKMAKRRIMQIQLHDSPGLVFWCQRSWQNSNGITPYRGQMQVGRLKSATFDEQLAISRKLYKIDIVSIKVEYEVVYALSNGYVADDLG